MKKGKNSESIPNNNSLKAGTLRQILQNIASHLEKSLDEFEDRLFYLTDTKTAKN